MESDATWVGEIQPDFDRILPFSPVRVTPCTSENKLFQGISTGFLPHCDRIVTRIGLLLDPLLGQPHLLGAEQSLIIPKAFLPELTREDLLSAPK